MMQSKCVAGFTFLKIGVFYRDDTSKIFTYQGQSIEHDLSLKLINDDLRKLEESAYLIFSNEDMKYVGEYSFNLADRWLKEGNYVWHHKEAEILNEIKSNNCVSLWASENPYVRISNEQVNISKSIESHILKTHVAHLPWNKRGKLKRRESWFKENCLKMTDIFVMSELAK